MSENYLKLKKLLRELFQLDQADLDFGIYRIMNQKQAEIDNFLDRRLLPKVREVLSKYDDGGLTEKKEELAEKEKTIRSLGYNPDENPVVIELRRQISAGFDISVFEGEIYSHLYNFFRRYYHEGDFMSLRRYKEGVYAIPYEGEEVKLHWANADQYYIKSADYLRNYTFKLDSGKRVHFKLVDATTEQNNNKSQNGKERRFILCENDFAGIENGELVIRFQYKPDNEKRKQDDLNKSAVEIINQFLSQSPAGGDEAVDMRVWWKELFKSAPTPGNENRKVLEKHLRQYTARYSFDYFIHKDLGGFLRRELDFYIKNEVMFLDDIEDESAPKVESYLGKIKAIRVVAGDIIRFLEQLENFQKKLWLKKKFVIETNYCITMDRVPEALYPEVLSCEEQLAEWKELFAIDEIKADLLRQDSENINEDFLRQNPYLVLDTKFFGQEFKDRLLSGIEDFDEAVDGVLIHSENFQALNLLQERYREKVKCVYIDPPYNTGNDGFMYKDNYGRSSWLSMIENRTEQSNTLCSPYDSFFAMSIDKRQMYEGKLLLQSILINHEFVNAIVNVNNPKGRSDQKHLPTAHDNILLFASDGAISYGWSPLEKVIRRYRNTDKDGCYREIDLRKTGDNDRRIDRPKMFYPFYFNEQTNELIVSQERFLHQGFIEIYPMKSESEEGCWRWEYLTAKKNILRLIAKFMPVKQQWSIFEKDYIADDERVLPTSIWDEKVFNSERATELFINLGFEKEAFYRPKPVGLLEYLIEHLGREGKIILDYFAGSGTTAHAVINLNREDGGKRKYILVEMGDYFDTVLKPRIRKVVYSKDWKEGKPVSREGSSHMFKYFRLESYEDALNNLTVKRTEEQSQILMDLPEYAADEYMLSYMLDVETAGSASLLDVSGFENPFEYKLKVTVNDELVPVNVDLVETFNYLIGLEVKNIDVIRGIKVVQGIAPDGSRVLVIWRNMKEMDNDALDKWFGILGYNSKDMEFDLIYINGDNNIENLRKEDQTWKVRLIEEEFKKLMFNVEGV